MKSILTRLSVLVMAICATGMSVWGAIEWGTPQNIVGDVDVSTNGVQRYAYSWGNQGIDSIVVNGQTFVPSGMGQGTQVDVVGTILSLWDYNDRPARDWVSNQTQTATCSLNYLNLLRRAMFNDGGTNGMVELRNLIPGRRYEVQLWSTCCFSECAGSRLILDRACTLSSSSGDAEAMNMGQWVTGVFICPASGTQTFSVTGVTGKWMFVNALQVRDVTDGPIIQWEEPRDVSADTEVNTEGRLLYAYNPSGEPCMVNGVPFEPISSSTWPANIEGFANIAASQPMTWTKNAYGSAGVSTDYARLVMGGFYRDNSNISLTLRNLIPGRSYLVQTWVSDSRSVGDHRWVTLDGVRTLHLRTDTGCGQSVLGRFRAVAPTQAISIVPGADSSSYPSSQWNAIQVRELTPRNIEWEPAVSVTGEESVLTEGEGVWAYYWTTNSPVTVNGVAFADAGSSATAIGTTGDITLEGFLNVNKFVDFFPTWETAGATTNLHHLLRFGVYSQKLRISRLHLHHLTPGRSYLLQIFASDQRGTGTRSTLVDGRVRLHHTVNEAVPLGDYVVGRFTATAPDLTIPLSPLAQMGSVNTGLSAQINAIQLRQIGSVCEENKTNWSYLRVTTNASDVATEGTLAYAYTYAGADLTVNGVRFTGWTNGQRLGNDADFSTGFTGRYNGFCAASTLAAGDPYRTLLSNGAYVDSVANDITLTLKNLTIGHAYLVQVWVHDTRGGTSTRYWQPDGGEAIYYGTGYGVGRFIAKDLKQTFTMTFMEKHAQLNALQVRDLGPMENVTQVDDGTLTLTENLTTKAVCSTTPLTITGAGALNATDGVFAPTSTIDVAWSGTDFVKLGMGMQTLNGAADALTRVWACGGTLCLNGTVPQPLELHLRAGSTLAVGEGNSVTANVLEGAGACTGPGTLEFANPDACRTDAALGGGLTVRKTGLMDWWHYGSLDGATLLCETGTVWIADGAKTGAFGLAGRVNFLDATVAGTLTAVDDLETMGLVFGTGASLALDGTAALHATDDLDLDGVAISVATARRAPDNVLVRADGTLSGTPSFFFAEKGYRAYFNADLNAWCAKHGGFVIYVR